MSLHAANRQKYLSTSKIHSWAREILVLGSISSRSSGSGINHFPHILALHYLWNLLHFWVGFFFPIHLFPFMARVFCARNWALKRITCILQLIFFTDFPMQSEIKFVTPVFSPLFFPSHFSSQLVKTKQKSSVRAQLLKRKVGWSRICPLLNYPENPNIPKHKRSSQL